MSIDNSDNLATMVHPVGHYSPPIHQASGILMARYGTTIEEALASLHETAETTGIDVKDVAASIVTSTRRP